MQFAVKHDVTKVFDFDSEVEYLGHIVGSGQRRPDTIANWKPPANVQEVRQFLGTTGYLVDYIRNFSTLAAPLHDITKKGVSFRSGGTQQTALDTLKQRLISKPVLRNVNLDLPFIIITDASDEGVGACLMQAFDDGEFPVAYYSKRYTPTQKRYAAYESELFVLNLAVQHWFTFLDGRHFTIRSDHSSLQSLTTQSH